MTKQEFPPSIIAAADDFRVSPHQFDDRPLRVMRAIDTQSNAVLEHAFAISSDDTDSILHVSVTDASLIPVGSELDTYASQQFQGDPEARPFPKMVRQELSLSTYCERPALTVHIPFTRSGAIGSATLSRERVIVEEAILEDQFGDWLMQENGKGPSTNLCFAARALSGTMPAIQQRFNKLSTMQSAGGLVALTLVMASQRAVTHYMGRHGIEGIFRIERGTHPNFIESWPACLPYGIGPEDLAFVPYTSPLRRYADLVNQRRLTGHLLGDGTHKTHDLEPVIELLREPPAPRRQVEDLRWTLKHFAQHHTPPAEWYEALAEVFFGQPPNPPKDTRQVQHYAMELAHSRPGEMDAVYAHALKRGDLRFCYGSGPGTVALIDADGRAFPYPHNGSATELQAAKLRILTDIGNSTP